MTSCNVGSPISPEELSCHWSEVSTPYISKTLNLYFEDPEVIKWLYISFGRLFHKSNLHDKWHITPYIVHPKGSSKFNILLKILQKYLYIPRDTFWMDNSTTTQELNGAEESGRKLLAISQGLDENMKISQSSFESAMGSEKKNETDYWTLPSILFGESIPFEYDPSVTKRLLVFKMKNYKPIDGTALRKEVGKFFLKCNRAYLEQVNICKFRAKFLKTVSQKVILTPTADLSVTPLYLLLESGLLTFNKDSVIKLSDFYYCLRHYCEENNLSLPVSSFDFIKRVVDLYSENNKSNLRLENATVIIDSKPVTTAFIFGIEI